MSYSTRVYRQRNAHTFDNEANKEQSAFFSSAKESRGSKGNKPAFFQAKFTVGQPNDKYEQEADAVASRVVDYHNGNAPVTQKKEINNIQRYTTPVDEEKFSTNDERMKHDKDVQRKPDLQTKCAECEKEEKGKKAAVQMKANDGGGATASPKLSSRIEGASGKGNKLPRKTLSEMNSSFGANFSSVKIHTDSDAVDMNRELQAQAFTHGGDIYFNAGKFNPDTADGKRLLAHELTHVVQQGHAESIGIQRATVPAVQAACEDMNYKTCGGACTHPTSGNAGTCRWTGLTNGCKCFENPRSARSLMDVLPTWIIVLLSAAALAALVACFASGVCEAGIIIGAAGVAVGAIIIGIFRASGVQVNGDVDDGGGGEIA